MSIPKSLEQLQKVERELERWRERNEKLQAEFDGIRARREAAIEARFAEITDEQILTDEEIRRWALKHQTYPGSYNRVKALVMHPCPEIVDVGGQDGREGQEYLPRLTVGMERDSDVAAVVRAMNEWAETWLLGRDDVPVGVLEWSLSRSQSYGIKWMPEVDLAELHATYSGLLCSGSLHEVLAYVAEHHPYNNGHDMDDDEEDY